MPWWKGRVDQPDRARVDVAEGVSADDLVGRADVGAGAAADTAQRVADAVRFTHLAAAVVEQDDVHLLARLGSGDAGGVGAQRLRGGGARQELELVLSVGPGGDSAFRFRQ